MIYPIVAYGDPVLRKKAADIVKGELDVATLASDMFETMYKASGVGLAAPQIGKSIRMFVIDTDPSAETGEISEETPEEAEEPRVKKVFINAEILDESGDEWPFEEGCLSIPGVKEDVYREEFLTIHYFDENWVEYTEDFEGFAARVIQHEYDHIEGILFIDHLSPLRKRLLKGRLTDISKGKTDATYRMKFPLR
jgi:peptide deformylase